MSQLLLTNLGVVCPNCDELNPSGTARCGSCGADPYGPTPAIKALPGAGPPQGQPSRPPGTGKQPSAPPVATRVPTGPHPAAPTPSTPVTASAYPAPIPTPVVPIPSIPPRPGTVTATTPAGPTQVPRAISNASTPVAPMPAMLRTTGPKDQPPGLSTRPGARVVDVVPPGMRPTGRPGSPLTGGETPQQPIPASDLVKRPGTIPPAAAQPSKFSLAALAGAQRGQRVRLSTSCQVGRSRGQILFADDPFISALHASLTVRDGRLYIRDESSTSGTFVSVPGQEQIQQNAYFAAGGRVFRFMGLLNAPAAPQSARAGAAIIYGAPMPPGHVVYGVEEILVGNRGGRAVVTGGALLTIGTSKCDLSYPADDGMASRHCELSPTPSGALLRDLSGGLGTFVRLQGTERALNPGDKIRIGNQILQVEA